MLWCKIFGHKEGKPLPQLGSKEHGVLTSIVICERCNCVVRVIVENPGGIDRRPTFWTDPHA
jgi:hypothetical protein